MKRQLTLLILLLSLLNPSYLGAIEVVSLLESKNTLKMSVSELPLTTNPKSLRFKVEGQEIPGANLEIEPMHAVFAIDRSVTCRIVGLSKYLPGHLKNTLDFLPKDSTISIFTYDRKGLKVLQKSTPISESSLTNFTCSAQGSLGFGAIVSRLSKHFEGGVDVIIAYTSGNLFFTEEATATLNTLTKETFILPYLAPPQSSPSLGKKVHYRPKGPKENFLNWFSEIETYLRQEIHLEGVATVPLPETMEAGEYRGTIEILEDAKVAQSLPIVFQKFTPAKSMSLPYWVKVLLAGVAVFLLILLLIFFHTPKCKKCKRKKVRGTKDCLFCLKNGAVLLTKHRGVNRILTFRDQIGIGNTRQFDVYDSELPLGDGGFSIRRFEKIYQIAPYHKELRLNHQKIEQARYLRHGDQITIGDWTCQFFAKAS